MSVCLSVRLYTIQVKTAEPKGTKFCVGHKTQGKNMDHQNWREKNSGIFLFECVNSEINIRQYFKMIKSNSYKNKLFTGRGPEALKKANIFIILIK